MTDIMILLMDKQKGIYMQYGTDALNTDAFVLK